MNILSILTNNKIDRLVIRESGHAINLHQTMHRRIKIENILL
jgi:hypothetical protein